MIGADPVVARAQGVAQAHEPVWLVGAGGLLAGELARLFEAHPRFRLAGAITRHGGETLRGLHPALFADRACTTLEGALPDLEGALESGRPAWVVLALPHGEAARTWRTLRATLGAYDVGAAGLRVVDLSADHRLRDAAAHAAWYGPHPDPDELPRFVYGLPELAGDALFGAARIAAPGCFATALQLACLPAAEAGVLAEDTPWVVHAVTGSSGSGTRPAPGTHHPHRHGNFWAYATRGHRHLAELLQALAPCGAFPRVTFLPHSGPWVRGIHASAVLPLATRLSEDDARALYAARFRGRPFVEVLASGEPDLHRVVGSNRAALGVSVQGGMLVVGVTIDNLLKGGAGQALQAMNVSAGLPEETGLPRAALGAL